MKDWAWYPINRLDGRCRLLAHARIDPEGSEAEVGLLVNLDAHEEDHEYPEDLIVKLEAFDDLTALEMEAEILAVGTDWGHVNWEDFSGFRRAAFPKVTRG